MTAESCLPATGANGEPPRAACWGQVRLWPLWEEGSPSGCLARKWGSIPYSSPPPSLVQDPQGRGDSNGSLPPTMVLVQSSETARREQKPSVRGQRRKVPQALAHSQSLGCTPSGLPPWKLPPTLDNCPCGCLRHEPSPRQQGWLRCRLESLQCPFQGALPPWGPSPAGGRVAGLGRTLEYWEKASGLPLPRWSIQPARPSGCAGTLAWPLVRPLIWNVLVTGPQVVAMHSLSHAHLVLSVLLARPWVWGRPSRTQGAYPLEEETRRSRLRSAELPGGN